MGCFVSLPFSHLGKNHASGLSATGCLENEQENWLVYGSLIQGMAKGIIGRPVVASVLAVYTPHIDVDMSYQ